MIHDQGVVCANGHKLTAVARALPERAPTFCRKCGEAAIRQCEGCKTPLQGAVVYHPIINGIEPAWSVPNNCHSCGKPFPWTERKQKALIAAISELEDIEQSERDQLTDIVPDTITETPNTSMAVLRWQRVLSKVHGRARDFVVDVLKQAAVSILLQKIGVYARSSLNESTAGRSKTAA